MKTELDIDIKHDVKEELEWEPGIDATNIEVSVDDGIVTLKGIVYTYYEKFTAEEAALRVYGVRTVVNELMVELTTGFERDDADITAAAENILSLDTTIPEDQVEVRVHDGWVILEGRVEWNYQKINATNDVSNLAGVKGITNNITVEPTAQPEKSEKLKSAVERNALIDAEKIDITIDGTKAVLNGEVRTWTEKREAEKIAWYTPGIYSVENNIAVRIP